MRYRVLLWCKTFLFSCQDLGYSCFCCQELQEFSWISFHALEKSCKILRTLPKLIAKILARNVKNRRNFLARKPRRQALGEYRYSNRYAWKTMHFLTNIFSSQVGGCQKSHGSFAIGVEKRSLKIRTKLLTTPFKKQLTRQLCREIRNICVENSRARDWLKKLLFSLRTAMPQLRHFWRARQKMRQWGDFQKDRKTQTAPRVRQYNTINTITLLLVENQMDKRKNMWLHLIQIDKINTSN